jgi:hypothetical protein
MCEIIYFFNRDQSVVSEPTVMLDLMAIRWVFCKHVRSVLTSVFAWFLLLHLRFYCSAKHACIILCCVVLCCVVLCCVVLCCVVMWCDVMWCGVLCSPVLRFSPTGNVDSVGWNYLCNWPFHRSCAPLSNMSRKVATRGVLSMPSTRSGWGMSFPVQHRSHDQLQVRMISTLYMYFSLSHL